MARIKNFIQMTGSMGAVSMYTMQGHDEVIVRTKGGPTKRQIKTKPQFELVRRNNSEWSGCTKSASMIRLAFWSMKKLEDYPVMGALNAISKQIQKMDMVNELGKRSVLISEHKDMLSGFSFSRKQVLESILRVPITATLNRKTGVATIDMPEINTDLYLYNFRKLPFFRILANFSAVSDMYYSESEKGYTHENSNFFDRKNGSFESEWLPTSGTQPAMSISLNYLMDLDPIPGEVTLILSMGIEFGKNGLANSIDGVKYAGSGKIIKVG